MTFTTFPQANECEAAWLPHTWPLSKLHPTESCQTASSFTCLDLWHVCLDSKGKEWLISKLLNENLICNTTIRGTCRQCWKLSSSKVEVISQIIKGNSLPSTRFRGILLQFTIWQVNRSSTCTFSHMTFLMSYVTF